jgi:DnaJ-class molecular chaperone
MRRMRAANPEKYRERERKASSKRTWNPRMEARCILNMAIKRGSILRPLKCTTCGTSGRIEAHHPDYNKPLFVEWLCPVCHGSAHRKQDNNRRAK